MAEIDTTATDHISAPAPIATPTELIVILNPYNQNLSEFVGSRAMLEGEGIIPNGTKWPEGYDAIYWQDERFCYCLCRQRPKGAKGPRRAFLNCDWWCLRWELINKPCDEERNIMLKTQELKDALYKKSAKGQAEFDKRWKDYFESAKDEKFQEFKLLVPGLVRPPRSRPCKQAESSIK